MSRYWASSRSAYYGVVCAIPLLLIYELLLWSAGAPSGMQVRNAADVWLRLLLESLGLRPIQATLVMIGLLVAAIPRVRRRDLPLKGGYLLGMLGEAVVYSLALGVVINIALALLFSAWSAALEASWVLSASGMPWAFAAHGLASAIPGSADLETGIALSLGAGLFEELAFRVVLLNLLLGIFRLVMAPRLAAVLAILVASLVFSLAHFVGDLGEPFTVYAMLFRLLAGLLFTLLYYQRGFAITAWSHALYDVWVLVI